MTLAVFVIFIFSSLLIISIVTLIVILCRDSCLTFVLFNVILYVSCKLLLVALDQRQPGEGIMELLSSSSRVAAAGGATRCRPGTALACRGL